MPWVTAATYQQLARHLEHHDCARPVDASGQPGYPTGFRKEHACELMNLHGHRTETRLIPDRPYVNVMISDSRIHTVVTTPDDLPVS